MNRRSRSPDGEGAEWMGEDLATSRTRIEDGSVPVSTMSSRKTAIGHRRRGPTTRPPRYSEWASVGSGGREDGEYNLEAFVSAERRSPTISPSSSRSR